MPDSSPLHARPSLTQLRKQAKELVKQFRAGDADAARRFHAAGAQAARPENRRVKLADAQFVLAHEHGFETWAALVHHIEEMRPSRIGRLERFAGDLHAVYDTGDPDALRRLGEVLPGPVSAQHIRKKVDERWGAISDATGIGRTFTLDAARLLVARQFGFDNWTALLASATQPATGASTSSAGLSRTSLFYRIDGHANAIEVGQLTGDDDWDAVVDLMEETGLTGLNANGQMTDAALERLARLDHVTSLRLGGSKRITDQGLRHLARMPALEEIDLSGGAITDRGLEVLRHVPNLRRFQMCWQAGVSDAGIAHLRFCERLESVDLLGTPTGDGAIEAVAGKPNLSHLKTGRRVTDAGLRMLSGIPAFRTWRGGEASYGLMDFEAGPTFLLIDGPFTDAGIAALADLDGLFGLSLFWHTPSFSSDGLAALAALPNLGFLGCDGKRCDDRAMQHIGAMPYLRMLLAQGTIAGDEGFAALSRSQTLEYLWGRECPNLRGRGFAAMATMPALRGLAVSCKHVGESALSSLPDFPALRALMPMDVSDDGFRHVGQCRLLEDLWCMYCRETGDRATEHIANSTRLRTYCAGSTRISDYSLEILGRLRSLENIEFHRCNGITDAGVARLAQLPRLREIAVEGSPNVTRNALAIFRAGVRVRYSP